MSKPLILILDGNSIAYRAFFKAPPLTNAEGVPTGVLHIFMNSLFSMQTKLKPEKIIAVFDAKGKNKRHDLLEAYKATRESMPEDLIPQIEALKEMLPLMGIPLYCVEGYEADDVIATLAVQTESDVLIATRDKDIHQLVDERVKIYDSQKSELGDVDYVREKFGVEPKQILDLLALMGDASDNIPGVKGVGEKTAAKLIQEFGSLEGIYENIASVKGKMQEKLIEGKEMAFLSRQVATLEMAVPLPDAHAERNDEQLAELFARYGLKTIASRFFASAENVETAMPEPEAFTEGTVKAPELVAAVEEGIFVVEGSVYAPFDPSVHTFTAVKSGYDLKTIYKKTGHLLDVPDVLLLSWLNDPDSGGMKQGKQPLGEFLSDISAAVPAQLDLLKQNDLISIYEQMEVGILAVLAQMELTGILVSPEQLKEVAAYLETEQNTLQNRIDETAGEPLNVNSPKQLGAYLYDKLGIKPLKKNKTGFSTAEEVLRELILSDPEHAGVIEDVLKLRETRKLLSTYTLSLLEFADEQGRIHTDYKQTGTATGRLSSTNPNLQNIPQRGETAKAIRSAFIASEGMVFCSFDYSQIELRILAHLTDDERLVDAFRRNLDIHTRTAAAVFHTDEDAVTPEARRMAKAVNFGILYGLSAFGLARDTGVSPGEAKAFIEKYFALYPGVRQFLDDTIENARKTGFCETLLHRKRFIRDINSKNGSLRQRAERIATNAPIQGSASDIIKLAMLKCADYIAGLDYEARMLLQIHDELIFEVDERHVDDFFPAIQQIMESVITLSVPLTVNGSHGKNWGELK